MRKKRNRNKGRLVRVDIRDILLDEKNTYPIIIKGKDGTLAEFDQIAVIPHEDDLYAVLKPHKKFRGAGNDDAVLVKVVKKEKGSSGLEIVDFCEQTAAVFKEYYKSYYEEGPEGKKILNRLIRDLLKEEKYDEARVVYEIFAEAGDKEAESSLEILIKEKEKNN